MILQTNELRDQIFTLQYLFVCALSSTLLTFCMYLVSQSHPAQQAVSTYDTLMLTAVPGQSYWPQNPAFDTNLAHLFASNARPV